jgi:hypothetical protein
MKFLGKYLNQKQKRESRIMKRVWLVLLSLLVLGALTSVVIAASGPQTTRSAIQASGTDDTGGPDAFGYTWIDSNEPGGPTFNFIDISDYATLVEGLGDDNVVGPFPIGFSFHYYWYDVNQFWVGSNGWIKFSGGGMLAADFPIIPDPGLPNDIICPFTSDLFFGSLAPGRAYYWSNNIDSCIISWNEVQAWNVTPPGPTGSHTFEIILTAADSNITFQIGAQSGSFYTNTATVGIENSTGQIGLQVMFNQLPAANTAYLFDYPDEVTYQAHDLAAAYSMNDGSKGMFAITDSEVEIRCAIQNVGNQEETDCPITASVLNSGGQVQWTESQNLGTMAPGELREITFGTNWTPSQQGTYRVRIETDLTNDMNPSNDRMDCELGVVTLPGELKYDDGTSEWAWGWAGGNGGMGVKYTPPTYPISVDQVSFYYTGTTNIDHELQIIDDDGGFGAPGTVLYSETIQPANPSAWNYYTIDPPVIIEDGAFYLGLIQTLESNSFAMDTSSADPQSRQTWEFTGVWAPFRYEATHEYMIRCNVSSFSAVEPGMQPVTTYRLLENYPNPFNPATTIRYSMTQPGQVTLKIYDITGRLVNTLIDAQMPQGIHRISWDGRDANGISVATGVYFYTIETPNMSKTAKMVLIK